LFVGVSYFHLCHVSFFFSFSLTNILATVYSTTYEYQFSLSQLAPPFQT
jgi:hypothetical protein